MVIKMKNKNTELKEQLLIAKRELYMKIARYNVEKNEEKKEQLLREIDGLRDQVDSLTDDLESKEKPRIRRGK